MTIYDLAQPDRAQLVRAALVVRLQLAGLLAGYLIVALAIGAGLLGLFGRL